MILESNVGEFTSAVYGTVGALVAGAGIQFFNKLADRKKDQLDEHVVLRKELREELDSVKQELHLLQASLDEWKEKYYTQVEITSELKIEVAKLTDELTEYKRISGIHHSNEIITNNGWFDLEEKD
jgi:hypothetical protein